jgi:peptidoglycan hydrolase-like protein with peptidoglycan-binding domain
MRLKEFVDFVQSTSQIMVPRGTRGPAVADLQKALLALGYKLPIHGVDGFRGPETNNAIKQFEKDNALTQDGSPDKAMIDLINKKLKDQKISFVKSTEADVKPGKVVSQVKQGPNSRIDKDTRARAKASVASLDSAKNTKDAVKYFISKGWSPEQAAGIVGNLQAESGRDLQIDAVGDKGRAYGIAQWHPDRQQLFRKAFGKDIRQSSLGEQLAFVQWELENTEKKAASMLSTARTAEEAAIIFDKHYERSAGLHKNQRIAFAQALISNISDIG